MGKTTEQIVELKVEGNFLSGIKTLQKEQKKFSDELLKTKEIIQSTFEQTMKSGLNTARKELKQLKKVQKTFKSDVLQTKEALRSTFSRAIKESVKTATKQMKKLKKKLAPLEKKRDLVIDYKDRISQKLKRSTQILSVLNKKKIFPVVAIKDKATGVLNKIREKFASLSLGGVLGGLKDGVASVLKSGFNLEKQSVSMEHFIGVNNKGMTPEDAKKTTKDYMQSLKDNASGNAFDLSEVMTSGTTALKITGGDTKGAMELVKIAEDMAALNPGKSLEEAMAAVAALKNGDAGGMLEFGMKVSTEDMENMGGVDEVLKSQVAPFFEGGAEKLSNSTGGLLQTVSGQLTGSLQTMGLSIIEQLQPQIEAFAQFVSDNGPIFESFGERVGTGVGFVIDKFGAFQSIIEEYSPMIMDVIGQVSTWISEKFNGIEGETGFLKEVFSKSFSNVSTIIQVFGTILKPIFKAVGNSVRLLYNVFKIIFPKIQSVVETVWEVLKPIVEGLGGAISWISGAIGKVADYVGNKATGDGGKAKVDGSHATGLKRVPFDGYIGELHKDERILTAQEATVYNAAEKGQGFRAKAEVIISKIADTIVVRQDSDIDAIAETIWERLNEAQLGRG